MSFYEILLAKKLEDKRDPQVKGLTVTKNGTYSESGTVYNVVNVNVPLPENCYQKKSVSGAMVSFTDGSNEPLSDLVIFITAVQSGSGDPSPTNIRPISGWTGANITNKDDIDNPTVTNTYSVSWQTEAGTVYGGNIDLVSGALTVTMAMMKLSEINSFSSDTPNAYGYIRYNCIVDSKASNYNIMCDKIKVINERTSSSATSELISGYDANNRLYFTIDSTRLTGDLSTASARNTALKTLLTNDDITVVYELATPLTYQLTPIMVRTLLGNNNIYADCGAIDVLSYFTKLN